MSSRSARRSKSLAAPAGFLFSAVRAGIKESGAADLALIHSEAPASAAGIFTSSRVKAAPVLLDRARLRKGCGQSIVVNSGNANACTGEQGMKDAKEMARLVAEALGIPVPLVLVSSTGIIGRPMPMEKIRAAVPALARGLRADALASVARAILTTDTRTKIRCVETRLGGTATRVCGFAKGAGMIRPRLHATMLAYVLTDATVPSALLARTLADGARKTFNRITVDGDTSTNDTLITLANGAAGGSPVAAGTADEARLRQAYLDVLGSLAEEIVADGEGAAKLVRIRVVEAKSEAEAEQAGFAVANSPLVKTAFAGGDPNWGRILAALGVSGVPFDPLAVSIRVGGVPVVLWGLRVGEELESRAARVMRGKRFDVEISLSRGGAAAEILTCDLTQGYIEINAHYTT